MPVDNHVDVQQSRRALEALRNGVPNKEAVELLGCSQPRAESRFKELLSQTLDLENSRSYSSGMLVSGDFGSGKSHLLAHLEHQALSQGFVCSKVAVSKETPLYDLDKVFKSAVNHGRMPDRTGQLIDEIGHTLNLNTESEEYSRLFLWANSEQNGLSRIFPATLMVHERANDLDLLGEIRAFWSGDTIPAPRVKQGLRGIGQLSSYAFRAPKRSDLPPQRLRFGTELMKAAGYKGWVVLLDEIELVGSYSLLQRAKSYAELARWLGEVPGENCPGLVVIGTVSEDFAARILGAAGKKDHDYVGPRLRNRGEDVAAARAETGMRLLERIDVHLEAPTTETMTTTVERLRRIYTAAYDWNAPPPSSNVLERNVGYQELMRYKIRATINEWDLLRLFPGSHPETEATEFRHSYDEVRELEEEVSEDDGHRVNSLTEDC